MKKKVLSTLLLSTVLLSQGLTTLQTVSAGALNPHEVVDVPQLTPTPIGVSNSAIAEQDQKVKQVSEKQKEATSQLESAQNKVNALETEQANLQAETDHLESVSKDLEKTSTTYLRTLCLVKSLWKNKLAVRKRVVLF